MAKTPFIIRWRNAVMDDRRLSWRAKIAAMPLVRHADTKTGHNCFPGGALCAREMSVGKKTIDRGWRELRDAGYLEVKPLPEFRRKSQGALKVLRFPERDTHVRVGETLTETSREGLSGDNLGSLGPSTIPGNQEASRPEAARRREDCSMCGRLRVLKADGLCAECYVAWNSGDTAAIAALVELGDRERSER